MTKHVEPFQSAFYFMYDDNPLHLGTEKQRKREIARRRGRIPTMFYFANDPEIVDQRRRTAAAHRDQMLAFQKQSRDREYARFFKEQAQEAMKEYRGACLVLARLMNDPPGDCVVQRFDDWPPELIPYAERAAV